jgi:hypothetical protein
MPNATAQDEASSLLRASRRRRLFGAIGGGMLGSGLAALVLSGLNVWLGKPQMLVWWGLALGLPLAVGGVALIHRIED